jgi:uncharacterized membrane protein HdeD (DUF308 family)
MTTRVDETSAAKEPSPQSRGRRFLAAGFVLVLLGVGALFLSDAATLATGWILGSAVALGGAAVVIQALTDKGAKGFVWQLLFGSVEIVGGIVIVFKPLKGAAAIALLIVIIMVAQAITQIGLALSLRPLKGWHWPLWASLATLASAVFLVLRFPFSVADTPGEVAGLAMAIAGLSFVAMGGTWLKIAPARTL